MTERSGHREILVDGQQWVVCAIIEGLGWDQEIPVRRVNWLSFETSGERRFLAPLPSDWEQWPEDVLRAQLVTAPRSNRRPLRG